MSLVFIFIFILIFQFFLLCFFISICSSSCWGWLFIIYYVHIYFGMFVCSYQKQNTRFLFSFKLWKITKIYRT